MKKFETNQVSAVVCALNEENRIEACLKSLKESGVGEIILVDGLSDDNTVSIGSLYADKVVYDEGKGLGSARNLGIQNCTKKYILNFGPDNLITKSTIEIMMNDLQQHVGVSCKTSKLGSTYLNRCTDIYRKLRFRSGPVTTVGTPSLFRNNTLQKYPFDNSRKASDDSELCERISKNTGQTFYISDAFCQETGSESINTVKLRWLNLYGRSDYENFRAHKNNWSLLRKLRSLLYPLINELLLPIIRIRKMDQIQVLPFLFMITIFRYFGWIKYAHNR